eukprot:Sspe_Gene.99419::Locus_72944_Transcript_1_3_Confidence_0.500_Length_1222::g.99419::m.99419
MEGREAVVLGLVLLGLVGLSTVVVSRSSPPITECSGHGFFESLTKRCVCNSKWAGEACEVCEFPRYGPQCNYVAPKRATEGPLPDMRVAILCGLYGVTTSAGRLTDIAKHIPHSKVYHWGSDALKMMLEDGVNTVVLHDYFVEAEAFVKNITVQSPHPVTVVVWLWGLQRHLDLWREVKVDMFIASSLSILAKLNDLAPVESIPIPFRTCERSREVAANVTVVGDYSQHAASLVDELEGFGVVVYGRGWEGHARWAGTLLSDFDTCYLCNSPVVIEIRSSEAADDAFSPIFLDVMGCGAVHILPPKHSVRHELFLRHHYPTGVYPQSLFDLRVQIDHILKNPRQREKASVAAKDFVAKYSLKVVAKQLRRTILRAREYELADL